jgi:DNA-binding MarR family transcriptional regulator
MDTKGSRAELFRVFGRLGRLEDWFFAAAGRKAGLDDFTRQRGGLLWEIREAGGRLQVQDAAERTGRNKSAAAELVAKLCRDGYTFKMRVAGDGRGVWVVLTAKGRRAATVFSRASSDLKRLVTGAVPGRDLERMERAALKLEKSIKRGMLP